jgi:hypothetical protein
MELEQQIRIANERREAGQNIDEILAELTDPSYCSPEQATQLRELFAPSANPLIPPERAVPVLHIDWGREIQPDIILSPTFTIQGGSLDHPPLIHFPIDRRIIQDDWNWDAIPKLERTQNGWKFDQELKFKKLGQYRFQIVVIDSAPDYLDPGYYRSSFRMDVVDPKTEGQEMIFEGDNVVANLDQLPKNARIKIVGENVTVLARSSEKDDKRDIPNWTTTVSFQSVGEMSKRVPYVSQPKVPAAVSRLTMTESIRTESTGKKCYHLIGGQRLTFGRDVPELNHWNDVPLEVQPGASERDHSAEFAHLNGLFSREHARLEVLHDGIELVDVRTRGIPSATIIDDQPLGKATGALLFSRAETSTVLFSKMLAMQFKPCREKLCDDMLERNLLESLPPELLTGLYALKPFTDVSAVCITSEQYYKQKTHAETLQKALHQTPLSKSDWWKRWFEKTNNADPRFGMHEYWFIPLFITLGRDRRSNSIQLEHRHWNDTRLRILCINDSLYVENISHDTAVEFGVGENYRTLPPFRPQPLCSGCFVRKGDAMLRFE